MNDVTQNTACDYLIIGAGVIGLCLGLKLMERSSDARVVIVEKEGSIAEHASGRNSGVLHAGFYYKPDTYKAKFTVAGNSTWRSFCEEEQLPINRCGKLVVADGPAQLEQLLLDARKMRQLRP